MSCAPPPPLRPPPLRPPPAADLAPGFRFHPTDEELVGFYLKRKVLGRPFRVDAITEIDLYKSDPWDLPGKSRIQSRDMEWFFFSGLDKKYPNRSLTNRATGSGYWKTTGKDRAVYRGGRTVGMKKTLVFHIGRAPKGERTNWVMHEYRLEDEELARAAIPQDAFVVCRIFQKSGPGPRNGAQYGAPLVEEWEDDDLPVINEEGALIVVKNSVVEMDGDEQNKDMGVQDESATLFVEPDDLGELNDFVNSDSLVKVCQKQGLHNVVDGNTGMTELRSHKKLGVMGGYGDAADSNRNPSILEDGYLELNDFAYPVECDCHESVACPEEILKNEDFANAGIIYPQELHDITEYFNTTDLNNGFSEQFLPSETGSDNCCVALDGLLCTKHGDYYSGEPADDGLMYFDAPNHYPHADHGSTSMMNSCIDVTMANSGGPDPMDELLAYFDATENMQPSDVDLQNGTFSNQPNIAPVPSAAVGGHGTSTSSTADIGEHSSSKSVDNQDEPDEKSDNSWDKALSKHLFSMLDAISPPPAFAAEYPVKGSLSVEQHPAARPSSSIRITAGLIQIHGATMSGNGKEWSMQKNVDAGFILSYGTTRDAITGNMAGIERMSKMPGGITVFILRNSFHLLFLSVLFLAASFKIAVYICTR